MHTLRKIAFTTFNLYLLGFVAPCMTLSLAKGLDDLSDANPEKEDANAVETPAPDAPSATPAAQAETAATPAVEAKPEPVVRSAASLAIEDKLLIGTSYSWVKASKSEGTWKSNGMTDVLFGYKTGFEPKPGLPLWATYRYAPSTVTVNADGSSLRGVLEGHYFGARTHYSLKPSFYAFGSGELGYVKVHMRDTDKMGIENKYNNSGMSFSLGGGADWMFGEPTKWTVGPRVHLGFGTFKIVQFGGAIGFIF